MKKFLTLLLFATLFIACSSDDDDKNDPPQKNNFIGTKWTASDDIAELFYGKTCTTTIEFLDNTKCQEIDVRQGMKYGAGTFVTPGTYTFKEDSVIWTVDKHTIRGKISGSIITTNINTFSSGPRVYTKK